jgi:ferredoxin/flavodoxin---NADP+ reductase
MNKIAIHNNIQVALGVYLLSINRFADFIPGQVVKITSHLTIAPRMYSIASGNKDDEIQIIYDIKPEGQLTNILKDLHSGDFLYVSQPFGQFICQENDAWWIATGTGIAPFYSMLVSEPRRNIKLIHGVRHPEALLFKDEFENILGENYIKCCTRADQSGIFPVRVTDYIRKLGNLPADKKFFLCGSAEMVVDMRDLLIEKGVSFGNIFSEIYF